MSSRLRWAAASVVGLVAASAGARSASSADDSWTVERREDRCVISCAGEPVADFVFRDDVIKRPYLTNVRTPGGVQVTRNHPPKPDVDATDHDTMHPGIWLAFGSLNGEDFWRNKGTIRTDEIPLLEVDRKELRLRSVGTLIKADGAAAAKQMLDIRFRLVESSKGRSYVIDYGATLRSETDDLIFGDQEEMGLGVRMATPLTEKAGGKVTAADGRTGAKAIWGTIDRWVDYGGEIDGKRVGVRVVPAESNVRKAWWHTRDYGVFVANPFGKRSQPEGAAEWRLPKGTPLELSFTIEIYEGR